MSALSCYELPLSQTSVVVAIRTRVMPRDQIARPFIEGSSQTAQHNPFKYGGIVPSMVAVTLFYTCKISPEFQLISAADENARRLPVLE